MYFWWFEFYHHTFPIPRLLSVLVRLNFIPTPPLPLSIISFGLVEFYLHPFPHPLSVQIRIFPPLSSFSHSCVSMKTVTHTTDRFIKKQFLLEYKTLPLGFFMKVVTHTHTHTTDTDRFDKIFLFYWIKQLNIAHAL